MSCEDALNTIIEYWKYALDDKYDIVSIFLDLKKAFDSIEHSLIIEKLKFYSFSEKAINLIVNYLENIFYQVKVEDSLGPKQAIDLGVPQGAVLGPLLFIIYMNDINMLKLQSPLILFADDSTISFKGKDASEFNYLIQKDLALISEWLNHNRLVINWEKTNFMSIVNSKFNKKNYVDISINFDGHVLERVKETKLLGVIIDEELKFDKQVSNTCIKANYKSKLISRSFYLFNLKFRATLFKLFIIPNFDYCSTLITTVNSIALSAQNHNIIRLTKCFNYNLKIFINVDLFKYDNDLEKQLQILKPFNIFPLNIRLFWRYYSYVLGLFTNRKNTILLNNFIVNERLSSRNFFKLPNFKSSWGSRSLRNIATKLANKYKFNLANGNSKLLYLKYLNKFIFENFESCSNFFE